MLQKDTQADANVLHRFAERFRQDPAFHRRVESDAQAALSEIGVQVPKGVRVRFAPDAASALDMTMGPIPAVQPSPVDGEVLDDALLLEVNGGTAGTAFSHEIRQFLKLFKPDAA
ncbi:MAG: hypothetical protein WBA83_06690 [Burkholderiaceae bacterium]